MQSWKNTLKKWLVKLRQASPWRSAPRTDKAKQQDDIARWVDEGGSGSDPRRAV